MGIILGHVEEKQWFMRTIYGKKALVSKLGGTIGSSRNGGKL